MAHRPCWGVAALALLLGCGDDDGVAAIDARSGDASAQATDASPSACEAVTFTGEAAFAAGASEDLYAFGPGAWVGQGAAGGPPGDIVYVEAYDDAIDGTTIDQQGFLNWQAGCAVCVFYGRGCASYEAAFDEDGNPAAPVQCDSLYMLDRGVIELDALDVSPAAGTLAGTVSPRAGAQALRLVEVFKTGAPTEPDGYGMRVPGGACLEAASLAFSGTWPVPRIDAGVDATPAPDAAPTDGAASTPPTDASAVEPPVDAGAPARPDASPPSPDAAPMVDAGPACPALDPIDDGTDPPADSFPNVSLSEINPGNYIELYNRTAAAISFTGGVYTNYRICSPFNYTGGLGITIPAHGYAHIDWPVGFTNSVDGHGEIVLFRSTLFGTGTDILNYVCWGTGTTGRKTEAEAVGKWVGACAPAIPAGGALHRRRGTAGTTAASYTASATTTLDCSPP